MSRPVRVMAVLEFRADRLDCGQYGAWPKRQGISSKRQTFVVLLESISIIETPTFEVVVRKDVLLERRTSWRATDSRDDVKRERRAGRSPTNMPTNIKSMEKRGREQ
ncbi:MAG: hypothetical protein C5B54_01555 [Acidobacteria bacterium]|nr:MAG: hypothetical protein C5B54_01555 [Acidobacteriota bacterium]